jgi:hypothetical protein
LSAALTPVSHRTITIDGNEIFYREAGPLAAHRPARAVRRQGAAALRPAADPDRATAHQRHHDGYGGEITITVARGAIVLPEPLASIALALRYQRVADGEQGGWLHLARDVGDVP